ncbi:N-lysine methyltransferase KMT5A-A-like [Centropristis striata]|uniref:N-lysine methyltransferase KMT5A-A-like n=1 Tax=Centropristis striata TaxID=184440 RepID=UPI0027E05A4E|nr:N-lysine methyltransferase KMT5A-A-like [Centropristis striata]
MPPRISPLKDACHHVGLKTDKTWKLDVKYINSVKGRGVFALGSFCKGDFIVEYRGDLISDAEAQRRREIYHPSCFGFLFAFKWRGKTWCIDASREDGSFGRLVNDDHRHPNCRMKRIDVAGSTHLCLFAIKDIKEGEEITYNYGGEDCPWRKQMTTCETDTPCVSSRPVLMSEPQMNEAASSEDTDPQMTTCETDTPCVSSRPVLMSEPQMNEAASSEDTDPQVINVHHFNLALESSSHF